MTEGTNYRNRPIVRAVPVPLLQSDLTYQREPGPYKLKKLVENWDAVKAGIITVSDRGDGGLFVVDGWHRTCGARENGYPRELQAQVHTGLTASDEAELFLSLNDSKTVRALDRFKAQRCVGTYQDVNEICEIADYLGLTIGSGGIVAISTLEKVHNGAMLKAPSGTYPDITAATLSALVGAWGFKTDAVNAALIGGMGHFLHKYYEEVDLNRLVKALSARVPRQVEAEGKSYKAMGSNDKGVAFVLHSIYNNGLKKNRLSEFAF